MWDEFVVDRILTVLSCSGLTAKCVCTCKFREDWEWGRKITSALKIEIVKWLPFSNPLCTKAINIITDKEKL